jgi:prepilin-type N-terminal cleavage/methylation domain-containing protein
MTLIELLVASAILAMLAGGVAALAVAVQTSSQAQQGRSLSLQHGRVSLERIQRALSDAHASEQFPGFVAVAESGAWPGTIVAWSPNGAAADPAGLPRVSELVTFCADPQSPGRLLEIRVPADQRPVPPLSDTAGWQSVLATIKGDAAERIVLTNLLRVVPSPDGVGSPHRSAVRFDVALRPSAAQWDEYRGGQLAWGDIAWAQDIHGGDRGLRQVWCRIELQLRSGDVDDHSADAVIPLFGSSALYYTLQR